MRLIKGFLFAIAGLMIMITLISLLIPSRIMVSRGVVIHAPAQKIITALNSVDNWKRWHPVFKSDSTRFLSTAKDNSLQWQSSNKTNTFSITSSTATTVNALLERDGELPVQHILSILPLPDSTAVQVEWKALIRLKWYPWEKFYGIFIEKITGPGYEEALNGLKNYIEETPQ